VTLEEEGDLTRSEEWILLTAHSKLTSEAYAVPSSAPQTW